MSPTTNQILKMLDEMYENDYDYVIGGKEYEAIRNHIVQLDAALQGCQASVDMFHSILKEARRG